MQATAERTSRCWEIGGRRKPLAAAEGMTGLEVSLIGLRMKFRAFIDLAWFSRVGEDEDGGGDWGGGSLMKGRSEEEAERSDGALGGSWLRAREIGGKRGNCWAAEEGAEEEVASHEGMREVDGCCMESGEVGEPKTWNS